MPSTVRRGIRVRWTYDALEGHKQLFPKTNAIFASLQV